MMRKFSSFTPLAFGPMLCEPVITTGCLPKGSITTTLLCTIAKVPLSFRSSCTQYFIRVSIAAGSPTWRSTRGW